MVYFRCNVGEKMKDKTQDKKNKIVMIVILLILLVVVIALSYAAFRYSREGSENVITLGNLELTLTEGTTINLEDTYPLTDSEGLALDGYSFTLENTGTADVDYVIYLDNVEITSPDVKLDDMYLKYSIDKSSVKGNADYLNNLGADGSRILDQGTINSGEQNDYVLRVWPTTEIDGDFGGQVWKGKLRITGDQVRQKEGKNMTKLCLQFVTWGGAL